jgi:hypothetical protein
MTWRSIVPLLVTASALGCESSPVTPTVIPTASVPAVVTVQPNVWDRDEELRPWITPGTTTGAVTIAGEGAEAVIRVDVSRGTANLQGPDLEPALSSVRSARLRYRWIDRGADGSLFLTVYLRPITLNDALSVPRLTAATSAAGTAELNSGNWVERTFTVMSGSPPISSSAMRYALINVRGTGATPIHGMVEIDWIALLQ